MHVMGYPVSWILDWGSLFMSDRLSNWAASILKGQFWPVSVTGNSKSKYHLFPVGFYKHDVERQHKHHSLGFSWRGNFLEGREWLGGDGPLAGIDFCSCCVNSLFKFIMCRFALWIWIFTFWLRFRMLKLINFMFLILFKFKIHNKPVFLWAILVFG